MVHTTFNVFTEEGTHINSLSLGASELIYQSLPVFKLVFGGMCEDVCVCQYVSVWYLVWIMHPLSVIPFTQLVRVSGTQQVSSLFFEIFREQCLWEHNLYVLNGIMWSYICLLPLRDANKSAFPSILPEPRHTLYTESPDKLNWETFFSSEEVIRQIKQYNMLRLSHVLEHFQYYQQEERAEPAE